MEAVDGRPTWTDCDEAGDYVVPNVLSPRDLVFRPDNMDETVPHTDGGCVMLLITRIFRICPSQNWKMTQESVWVKVLANKTSHFVASWYRPPG